MAMTKEQAKAFDTILDDPAKAKADAYEEWKKDHPDGTEEEFEEAWGPVALTFGL
jgi:hypothetical protein